MINYLNNIRETLLLQTYLESSNRLAEGFLLLFQEKLGISSSFSYKTIEHGYDRDRVNEILDEIIVITNESVEGKEETFFVRWYGMISSNKENYADKRQKQNYKKSKSVSKEQAHDSFPKSNSTGTKKGFSYAVMGVGVRHKLISGISISPNHSVGETTLFPEAFDQTLNCHPNPDGVLGDGIYGCRWITNLVSENNATPYFLPRSNVTFKSKGALGWYDVLYSLWNDPWEWLEN